jgi:hypothetical protein
MGRVPVLEDEQTNANIMIESLEKLRSKNRFLLPHERAIEVDTYSLPPPMMPSTARAAEQERDLEEGVYEDKMRKAINDLDTTDVRPLDRSLLQSAAKRAVEYGINPPKNTAGVIATNTALLRLDRKSDAMKHRRPSLADSTSGQIMENKIKIEPRGQSKERPSRLDRSPAHVSREPSQSPGPPPRRTAGRVPPWKASGSSTSQKKPEQLIYQHPGKRGGRK